MEGSGRNARAGEDQCELCARGGKMSCACSSAEWMVYVCVCEMYLPKYTKNHTTATNSPLGDPPTCNTQDIQKSRQKPPMRLSAPYKLTLSPPSLPIPHPPRANPPHLQNRSGTRSLCLSQNPRLARYYSNYPQSSSNPKTSNEDVRTSRPFGRLDPSGPRPKPRESPHPFTTTPETRLYKRQDAPIHAEYYSLLVYHSIIHPLPSIHTSHQPNKQRKECTS
jgi:hypothetical protein